jgi:hypothetical protein
MLSQAAGANNTVATIKPNTEPNTAQRHGGEGLNAAFLIF